MFFSFLIFSLIFSVDFSLQADDGHRQSKFQENLKQNLNEINKTENVIKKSDLEELLQLKNQYQLKNCIEEFETTVAIHFEPDWSEVNKLTSPARQSIHIRRQKWKFILEKFADSVAVNRLNSELNKTGINQTTFCDDIAEIYFTLSDNGFIFNKVRNPAKKLKTFPLVRNPSKLKTFPFVRNPSQEKSILAFINSIYNFENKEGDKNADMVQIPKEMYIDLMRKEAHGVMIQHHYDNKIQRLKNAYRTRAREIRECGSHYWIDSELTY